MLMYTTCRPTACQALPTLTSSPKLRIVLQQKEPMLAPSGVGCDPPPIQKS